MTLKNTKIILFASLVATLAFTLMQFNDAEATNVNGSWDHNSMTFRCLVSGLTATANVNDCSDISTSTNALEQGSLTLTSGGIGSDVSVYAWANCNCGVGRASTTYIGGEIYYAYNILNKQLSWEDSTIDTSTDGYDWQTATAHEMGHNIGLADWTNPHYFMYGVLLENDRDATLTTHSEDHIEDEYP